VSDQCDHKLSMAFKLTERTCASKEIILVLYSPVLLLFTDKTIHLICASLLLVSYCLHCISNFVFHV